jgi:phosphatidylserine/phosphatidylglycerophosphate/cardiolipin synthase-like enzyme
MPCDPDAWSLERMCKDGRFVLPTVARDRPTLGEFTPDQVREVLRHERAFADHDLVDILELQDVVPQYLANAVLYLLQHRETAERRVALLRGNQYLGPESELLQQLFEQQAFALPAEALLPAGDAAPFPLPLPPAVARAASELAQRDSVLREMAAQVHEARAEPPRGEDGRRAQEALRAELETEQRQLAPLQAILADQQVQFLRTEDHRGVLERALREAVTQVLIISPWMNRRACDDDLCRLIAAAVARGVHVRIGYGMGRERNRVEDNRNYHNVQEVKLALRRLIAPEHASRLAWCQTTGTHQKILVCDRAFAVAGSFNWLSYRGDRDDSYRSETGILVRQPDQVAALAAIAEQSLGEAS